MKLDSKYPFSDDDPALDAFFRVREMATDDFAVRTLGAVRARKRRARIIRFTSWAGAAAACVAVLLSVNIRDPHTGQPGGTASSTAPAETEMAAVPKDSPPAYADMTAEELTAALYASFSEDDVVFYGQARTLEALLAEASELAEEDNYSLETLDFLILTAQN